MDNEEQIQDYYGSGDGYLDLQNSKLYFAGVPGFIYPNKYAMFDFLSTHFFLQICSKKTVFFTINEYNKGDFTRLSYLYGQGKPPI